MAPGPTLEQIFGPVGGWINNLFSGSSNTPSGTTYPTSTNTVYDSSRGLYVPSSKTTSSNIQNLRVTPKESYNIANSRYTVTPIVDSKPKYDYSNARSTGGDEYIAAGGGQNAGESTGGTIQPNYPAGSFDVTPFQTFYDKAYQELAPYYAQLLKEANGDLDLALKNLELDYQTGKRTTIDEFQNYMGKFGVLFPQEQTKLSGDLNKRGIALTENPAGQTQYAGGGQAATEVGMLNEDQRLRAEAVKRSQQRGLAQLATQKLQSGVTAQQSYRNETERQQAEHESRATSLGGQYQAAELAQKQAGINKANYEADTGVSSRPTSSNWMDYYKGWNPTAAEADFRAVYGGDIKKLSSSKPL